MADAGLDADVVLDIRAALQQVARLEDALGRASNVVVTADARAVTAAIDAAVMNADSAVQIVAEAAEVTGAIDAAIENADAAVTVTGDAADVTGSINAAVENADSSIAVQGSIDPGLASGIEGIGDSLDAASQSGIRLGTLLSGLSIAAAAAGLRLLADAASDLQESTSKAGVVFGEQFGEIEQFAIDAAEATGLSKQAALEATATFGNLFQALGSTRTEAAAMSPAVVQLAGDLASFNNLGVDETLEKLRSGLVGEVEPLRSLGVSFLAADVTAKALELGLVGVNGEITEGAKVQARLALITEQTSLAQGDFARTSEGLANQQRILSAELGNAAAAAGTLLLPAFEAIVSEARGAVPALGELGKDVLPALSDALVNLAPLIGTSVDLLVLLGPVLAAVATVISAIPPEAIALAGGFLVMSKAASLLGSGLGAASSGLGGIGARLAAVNPLVVAATIGAGALFASYQAGKERAADVAAVTGELAHQLSAVGAEFRDSNEAIREWLTGLVEAGTKIESTNAFADELFTGAQAFKALRLSAATATPIIAGGRSAVDEFAAGLGEMTEAQQVSIFLLGDLADQSAEATRTTLAARAATDQLTDSQEAELRALIALNAPQALFTSLLDRSSASAAKAAAASEALKAKYDPLAAVLLDTGAALESLSTSAPAVAAGIEAVTSQATPSAASLIALATGLDAGKLSEEQMAEAALALGTDLATLQGFVETTAGAVQGFIDTAVGGLPSIADAFDDANNDSQVSAREFIDGLAAETVAMAMFLADLQTIIESGFAEVAGTLSAQGVETAGTAAAELAAAARAGNTALLTETQAGLDARDTAITDSTTFLRDVLGPAYIEATGQVGTLSSDALATNFTPEEQTRIKLGLAELAMDENGRRVAAIAATVGVDAAAQYGAALGLDQKSINAAIAAGVALQNNAPTGAASVAGVGTGVAFAAGVAAGIAGQIQKVADKAAQLVRDAKRAADREAGARSPSRLFAELGANMALGVAVGLASEVATVSAEAEAMVLAAAKAVTGAALPAVEVASAAAAAAGAGNARTLVVVEAGAIVVGVTGSLSPAEAAEVGEGIADGLERRLLERSLVVAARSQ